MVGHAMMLHCVMEFPVCWSVYDPSVSTAKALVKKGFWVVTYRGIAFDDVPHGGGLSHIPLAPVPLTPEPVGAPK